MNMNYNYLTTIYRRMIDHEKNSTAILRPSADSRRVHVSYKRKYVHEVLINRLVKLAQEKMCGYVN